MATKKREQRVKARKEVRQVSNLAGLLEEREQKIAEAAARAQALRDDQLRQRVAEKAYGIYLERGQQHGYDMDDWLEAERVVLSEIGE